LSNKLSPLMQQFFSIKEQYSDCILFYRVGDFYEMFYDDAKTASKVLELTLTGKNVGQEERAPMCGVPFHAADSYIHKLVEHGYKVAICEQMEDPATAKGLVKREVIKIVTPGTITSGNMLSENENNYLASLWAGKDGMSVSYCDISTGELCTTDEARGPRTNSDMVDELVRLSPKEILVNREYDEKFGADALKDATGAYIYVREAADFSEKAAKDILTGLLGEGAVASSGLSGRDMCLKSLSALLSYLVETQRQQLSQITDCRYISPEHRMSLDKASLRNLEIVETIYEKDRKDSLLSVLDRTKTAMGGRLIKRWLIEPLNDADEINERQEAVEFLMNDPLVLNDVTDALRRVYDFERLAARIASGNANGRDLLALKQSVRALPEVKAGITGTGSALLDSLAEKMSDLDDVADLIEESISEDAPFTVREGSLIKDGYSSELEELKASIKDAKEWIAGLEMRERERTGIKNLKVGYNKVFGYYIDVTRSNADLVPDDYIRRQTLVNNERYVTPQLKEMESLVLNAEAKINKLEYDLFSDIRDRIRTRTKDMQRTSLAVGAVDVLCSFADVSSRYGYVRPEVNDSLELLIENGRHPVIEQTEGAGQFVANDVYLNDSDHSLMIITGPNMSGKSTYMRMTALIVLMAQAGCPVPCDKAEIGVVDRIFTRIGASDNLSQGQSTFYVEMSELSYILNCAGERSLVILDEIGRGTSTYDGLSIAWAAVEYLCNDKKHIRTLFATHYHELTELADEIPGVNNLNVDVSDEGGNIVFLHKIVPGAASRSYGIHVAKIAGVPKELLVNAERKLEELESGYGYGNPGNGRGGEKRNAARQNTKGGSGGAGIPESGEQLFLFVPGPGAELEEKLKKLDLMEVTPSQAIKILEELKALIDE
jgi:DNA mismatch repair protein MutS